MSAPLVAEWANFFAAEAGAAAALTGLVIVAISINLSRIVAFPHLPGRAVETLTLLVGVLLISSVGLAPGQSSAALGAEFIAIGLTMSLVAVVIQLRGRRIKSPAPRWSLLQRFLLTQAGSLPFVIAGAEILYAAPSGLYWLLPGVVFCLVAGVVNAWVLLVEIVR